MTRRRRERSRRNSHSDRNSARSSADPPRKPFPEDPRATFRLSKDFDSEVLDEEITIIRQLSEALTKRLGPNASSAEWIAAAKEIWAEDPELSGLADRLDELISSNPKSVARRLRDLERKEAEEEDD
jgi:hypothetical protein